MASKFLVPLDLSNFTNTPLANTSVGFVTVYVKNEYLKYLLPSGIEKDVVLDRPLDGLSVPTLATGISSSDTLLLALSKLQASLNNIVLTGDVTGSATYIAGLLTINATLSTSGLTPANIANWNTAYSWGDHALAGYLKSVGLSTTGNAITISNSPLTTNGTIALGFAGNAAQYINGEGNLVTFPNTVTQAQNLITEVYNRSGDTLTKGTIVYINGGQGNLPTVTKAIATSDATSAQTFGIVQSDITNMSNGYVVVTGRLSDIDTQLYLEGTQLYLSGATAGTWTSTKPYAPIHLVYIGIVVRSHPVHGIIEVNIQNGYEMDELHDVSALNPNDNDILQYKTATNLWTKVAGTTSNISEGTNLYYTDARTRLAISLTTSGTSGAATYDNLTGVINIPNYATALTVGSTVIASGTVSRILFEGTGNVLQQSANLLWDEANNLLKIPNAKLEGGQFYGSYQPKLNLSANSGFSAIQYEFNTAAFLVGHVNVYGIGGAQDVFFQGNPNNTNSYVALEAINSAGLILATANNTNPIQFRINRGLRATLNNVGFGYGVVPTATLHAKGNSDSVGNALQVESLTGNRLIIGNNGNHAINGSVSASNNLYITGDLGFTYARSDNANFFKVTSATAYSFDIQSSTFVNANGALLGIIRYNNGNAAYTFRSNIGYLGLYFGSNSVSGVGVANSIGGGTFVSGAHSNSSDTEGYAGAVNLQVSGSAGSGSPVGVNMHITLPNTSFPAVYKATNIKGTFNISSGANGAAMLNINPTYNQTGGTAYFSGIDYNPTITALSGAHYGFLIRPNTLNGIGLGATLPTANLHINNPNNNSTFLRIDRNNAALFDFVKGGSIGSHSMRVYSEGGSVVGQIGAVNDSGAVSFQLLGTMIGGPNFTTSGINFSTTGTSALGNPSFVFQNLSTANYSVYAGVIKSALIRLQGTHGAASGSGEYAAIRISNTINQTGGTGINYGIIYEPTITSITGAHYGLVIRPNGTLNGIGHTTNLPTATWHVKGNSDSVGSSFRVENLSNTSYFNYQNNGTFQFVAPFGIIAMRDTFGELLFGSTSISISRYITQGFQFSGNISATRFDGMQLINNAGFDVNGTSGNYRLFSIINNHQNSSVAAFNPTSGNATFTHIQINTLINQTGSATGRVVGIDYTPVITSITGAHYGLLVRPNTLNGFGLGATLPTATLHINSPNTVNSLKVDVGTVDSALLVDSSGEVTTRKFKWTIDLMTITTIDLVADTNFKIVSVTNIKNSPTTTILVNGLAYVLNTPISTGDDINISVSLFSVIKLNCEL